MKIDTPVAFMFFNRHETTLKVFERIRMAQPRQLVLISDGPRVSVPGEEQRVSDLRRKIENMIDWNVQLEQDYASTNMGCGPRLATGIGAVLSKYGRAIFVEDDCLPTVSFFSYAQAMLEKYENDPRIVSVSGTYFLKKKRMPVDFGFTHFPQIWGWAGWARSWEGYDRELKGWDDGFLRDISRSGHIPSFDLGTWLRTFKHIQENPRGTWDIQFWLLCLKKRGLTIFPYRNQITNIGYGSDATHTTCWWFSNKPQYAFDSELRCPEGCPIDLAYEKYLQQEFYGDKITCRNFFNCALLSAKVRMKRFKMRLRENGVVR